MFVENIRRLIKSAKKGDEKSQNTLSQMFYEGYGIPRFLLKKCAQMMKKNAKKGNAYSQYYLAKSYIEGIKPFKQNYQKYIFWLEKASEQDMADAQYELAFIYYRGIETPAEYRNKAISLLKKAAENGKDEAALSLGKMYGYQYTDEFPQDREQSLYWFDFAAEAGNAEAMQNLYDIYKSGIWVPKDMQKALYYLTMSSEGSSSALNKLGECYFNGKEVPQNYEKAFKLFQKIVLAIGIIPRHVMKRFISCNHYIGWECVMKMALVQKKTKKGVGII